MDFQRKYLIKYISLISYILKSCYSKTISQVLLKNLFYDLKYKILFGSEISFKCVPDDILEKLVTYCYDDKSILEYSLQIHKCLFVSWDTLKKFKLHNMQWVFVNVKDSNNCLPVLHYNQIVALDNFKEFGCLLTSTNLFNLSNCNFNCQAIMLRIIKPLIDYKPTITKNVSISVINSIFNEDTKFILDKVLYNYFSFKKFVSEGDIFNLDLNKCYPEAKYILSPSNSSMIYIKIIIAKEKNIQRTLYNCKKSFYISNLHSKLNEIKLPINTFLPVEKQLAINNLKYMNINNYNDFILNVIPDGLNNVARVLISSILPFIEQRYTDINSIKPIFLVYGNNGSGKELLIKSLSQFFGIRYTSQCCFDLPSNNITQFKKKIENLFCDIRKMTPCLLHLKNIEVLSFAKDMEQELLEIFIKEINIKSEKPIIIMATTNFKDELSPVLLRLFLKIQQIGNLSKPNREQLLKWILKRDSVTIKSDMIKKIIDHTTGFNYINYITLLLFAAKHHLSTNNKTTEIILEESEIMLAIDEINTTFTKSFGTPKIQSVKLDDIGGLKNVKDEIMSSLNPSNLSIKRSGILLYGPPGTGKTLLAKAIATECKYNFLSINGPELLNMYVGQSESNIREVFNKARSAVPCILFFDELDSLAPKRGSGSTGDRVVSQLLTELDCITNENQQIFVLGNTNRPDLIDSALLRPGRLDKKIFVGGCIDYSSKLQVLIALTKKFNLSPNVQLESLIELLPNEVTGAELYGICHNAWFNCSRRFIQQQIKDKNDKACITLIVTQEDFIFALNTFFIKK